MAGNEPAGQTLRVVLTPPGQFTVGRMDEEAKTTLDLDDQLARRGRITLVKMLLEYASEGTREFRSMAPGKRGCLYPDERGPRFFAPYSEANCVLECAWRLAEETCGCVPWFLGEHFPAAGTCEAVGNGCFRGVVEERYERGGGGGCKGKCPPDCEKVHYDVTPGSQGATDGFKDR